MFLSERGYLSHAVMPGTLVGYARCSTDAQDLTAQRQRLAELGVFAGRIYLDHGLTGTDRKRPGLDQALAALREGHPRNGPRRWRPIRWLVTCRRCWERAS